MNAHDDVSEAGNGAASCFVSSSTRRPLKKHSIDYLCIMRCLDTMLLNNRLGLGLIVFDLSSMMLHSAGNGPSCSMLILVP